MSNKVSQIYFKAHKKLLVSTDGFALEKDMNKSQFIKKIILGSASSAAMLLFVASASASDHVRFKTPDTSYDSKLHDMFIGSAGDEKELETPVGKPRNLAEDFENAAMVMYQNPLCEKHKREMQGGVPVPTDIKFPSGKYSLTSKENPPMRDEQLEFMRLFEDARGKLSDKKIDELIYGDREMSESSEEPADQFKVYQNPLSKKHKKDLQDGRLISPGVIIPGGRDRINIKHEPYIRDEYARGLSGLVEAYKKTKALETPYPSLKHPKEFDEYSDVEEEYTYFGQIAATDGFRYDDTDTLSTLSSEPDLDRSLSFNLITSDSITHFGQKAAIDGFSEISMPFVNTLDEEPESTPAFPTDFFPIEDEEVTTNSEEDETPEFPSDFFDFGEESDEDNVDLAESKDDKKEFVSNIAEFETKKHEADSLAIEEQKKAEALRELEEIYNISTDENANIEKLVEMSEKGDKRADASLKEIISSKANKIEAAEQDSAIKAVENVAGIVSFRINDLSGANSASSEGVAAGSDDSGFGVWFEGFANKSKQGKIKSSSGYKSSMLGGIIGVDTRVTDNVLIGAAFAHARSELKSGEGDLAVRSDVNTNIINIYGNYSINDNAYIKGLAAYGASKIDSRNIHTSKALSGYRSEVYNLEAIGGYRKDFGASFITPEIGARIVGFKDGAHTENTASNRKVSLRKGHSVELIGSIIAGTTIEAGESILQPSVHAGFTRELYSKNEDVVSRVGASGKEIRTATKRVNKTVYNAGIDFGVKQSVVEISAGYEAGFGNKFLSHTGTLKVRVSF